MHMVLWWGIWWGGRLFKMEVHGNGCAPSPISYRLRRPVLPICAQMMFSWVGAHLRAIGYLEDFCRDWKLVVIPTENFFVWFEGCVHFPVLMMAGIPPTNTQFCGVGQVSYPPRWPVHLRAHTDYQPVGSYAFRPLYVVWRNFKRVRKCAPFFFMVDIFIVIIFLYSPSGHFRRHLGTWSDVPGWNHCGLALG